MTVIVMLTLIIVPSVVAVSFEPDSAVVSFPTIVAFAGPVAILQTDTITLSNHGQWLWLSW